MKNVYKIGTSTYITNNEIPPFGSWYIYCYLNKIYKSKRKNSNVDYPYPNFQRIIMTDDQKLISEGIQPIDNESLEWIANNPSCEYVDIDEKTNKEIQIEIGTWGHDEGLLVSELEEWLKNGGELYKIIIPQEEPKKEYFNEKRGLTEVQLKDPNTCEYYKELGVLRTFAVVTF